MRIYRLLCTKKYFKRLNVSETELMRKLHGNYGALNIIFSNAPPPRLHAYCFLSTRRFLKRDKFYLIRV